MAMTLIEWAFNRVEKMSVAERRRGFEWLIPRLKAVDQTDLELLIAVDGKRLGVSIGHLRTLLKESTPWAPNRPRADREHENTETAGQEHQAKQRRAFLESKALELLRDPALLYRLGRLLDRLGLAGEAANSRIVHLVLTSRIQDRPISLTVKGETSAGKSFIVMVVLNLFPSEAYLALTGMSKQALVYSQEPLSHRTVVIFERPGAVAADYNIRTLQSEGRISFETVERDPATNRQQTVRVEREGPTNFIFTTTAPTIHPENETRHWDIFVDESTEQTAAVKDKAAERYLEEPLDNVGLDHDVAVWRTAQSLLKPSRVVIPYAKWIADQIPNAPIRMRRDFQRLLALIETITLLHQEHRVVEERESVRVTRAGLEDYYIARALVGNSFLRTSRGLNPKVAQLVDAVRHLYNNKIENGQAGPTITATEIAQHLNSTSNTVRHWLDPAIDHGWVDMVEEARGSRAAKYQPGKGLPDTSPLPPIENLAEAFPDLAGGFYVVDPITGETLALQTEEVHADA